MQEFVNPPTAGHTRESTVSPSTCGRGGAPNKMSSPVPPGSYNARLARARSSNALNGRSPIVKEALKLDHTDDEEDVTKAMEGLAVAPPPPPPPPEDVPEPEPEPEDEAPPATIAPLFVVGASVFIPRSDGSTAVGTVVDYFPETGTCTVEIGEPGSGKRKRVEQTKLKEAPPIEAPLPTAEAGGAKYPIGASVYVLRSNGEETLATVKKYEPTKKVYVLDLGKGQLKQANEKSMRAADDEPPPPPPPP